LARVDGEEKHKRNPASTDAARMVNASLANHLSVESCSLEMGLHLHTIHCTGSSSAGIALRTSLHTSTPESEQCLTTESFRRAVVT
jgi:hypothetical protein